VLSTNKQAQNRINELKGRRQDFGFSDETEGKKRTLSKKRTRRGKKSEDEQKTESNEVVLNYMNLWPKARPLFLALVEMKRKLTGKMTSQGTLDHRETSRSSSSLVVKKRVQMSITLFSKASPKIPKGPAKRSFCI
jgi:hypothetical protein